MFYNSFQSATAALEKLASLLAEEPTVPEPVHPRRLAQARGDVRFDDVEFGYGTGPTVLPHVDLHIPAGQSIALVGETGAGKSTIAKLLARFYDVRDGRRPARRARPARDRPGRPAAGGRDGDAGGVPVLRLRSARTSRSASPEATPEEIEAAARAVGVHDLIAAMPDGYDTEADKRGVRLSAGQRQLVSFARAFLADPALLILDEATSSLDVPGEALVQVGLQTLLADRTSVVIAHRLSTVMGSDRVLVIEGGRIVEDGSPDALVAAGGRFADLHADWQRSLRRTT